MKTYIALNWIKLTNMTTDRLIKKVVKAIKDGNHSTREIMVACKAEPFYEMFCEAIAILEIQDKITYKGLEIGYIIK